MGKKKGQNKRPRHANPAADAEAQLKEAEVGSDNEI